VSIHSAMPTELEEVGAAHLCHLSTVNTLQLVEFLHHGNTQIRQAGKSILILRVSLPTVVKVRK
jgi:hypothetical protein